MEVLYYFDLLLMDWLDLYNNSQFVLGVVLLVDIVLLLLIFVMLEKKLTTKISSIVAFLTIINAPELYDSFGFIGVFIFVSGLVFIAHKLVSYLSFVVLNSNSVPDSENSISKSVFFSLTGKKTESLKKNRISAPVASPKALEQYEEEYEEYEEEEEEEEEQQLSLARKSPATKTTTVRKRRVVSKEGELDG